MTDSERDTYENGIGILSTLETDTLDTNDPVTVSGVALPSDTVVNGGRGIDHYYPPDVLRDAVGELDGKPLVKNFHGLDGQADADDVIGKVTATDYQPGVGLVYEAEVSDREILEKIDNDFLEVSPSVARKLGETDDEKGAQQVETVAAFRDLAVVANGQPGANIEAGSNPAITALSRDALSTGFDSESESAGDTGSDDPSGASSSGRDTTETDSDTMSDTDPNLSDAEQALLDAVDSPEQARDVLGEYQQTEDATIVPESELDTLREDSEKVREILAEELDHRGSPFEVDTLCEKFTAGEMESRLANDEGEVEFESLSQSPETETTDEDEEVDTLSGLSDDDKQELRDRKEKHEYWQGKNDTMAEAEADAITTLADADSVEDVNWEAL